MAAGFRSFAAFWIGGISNPAAAPEPSCPCPDWTVEGSLFDSFRKDQTLQNSFTQEGSLFDLFRKDQTLQNSFTQKAEESTNRWRKKNCE